MREGRGAGRDRDDDQAGEVDRALPEAGDQPPTGRGEEQPEERERADHDRAGRGPDAEALRELRQHRQDQPEPQGDDERRRHQHPQLARDADRRGGRGHGGGRHDPPVCRPPPTLRNPRPAVRTCDVVRVPRRRCRATSRVAEPHQVRRPRRARRQQRDGRDDRVRQRSRCGHPPAAGPPESDDQPRPSSGQPHHRGRHSRSCQTATRLRTGRPSSFRRRRRRATRSAEETATRSSPTTPTEAGRPSSVLTGRPSRQAGRQPPAVPPDGTLPASHAGAATGWPSARRHPELRAGAGVEHHRLGAVERPALEASTPRRVSSSRDAVGGQRRPTRRDLRPSAGPGRTGHRVGTGLPCGRPGPQVRLGERSSLAPSVDARRAACRSSSHPAIDRDPAPGEEGHLGDRAVRWRRRRPDELGYPWLKPSTNTRRESGDHQAGPVGVRLRVQLGTGRRPTGPRLPSTRSLSDGPPRQPATVGRDAARRPSRGRSRQREMARRRRSGDTA